MGPPCVGRILMSKNLFDRARMFPSRTFAALSYLPCWVRGAAVPTASVGRQHRAPPQALELELILHFITYTTWKNKCTNITFGYFYFLSAIDTLQPFFFSFWILIQEVMPLYAHICTLYVYNCHRHRKRMQIFFSLQIKSIPVTVNFH